MLLQGHHAGVRSVAFTVDGDMLISGGDDQTIRVWDVNKGHCLRTMQVIRIEYGVSPSTRTEIFSRAPVKTLLFVCGMPIAVDSQIMAGLQS